MKVKQSTMIGLARVSLIELDNGLQTCEFGSWSVGLTLAIGEKAQVVYDKVSKMTEAQLDEYLLKRS